MSIADEISRIRKEYIPSSRVAKRVEYEGQVRKYLKTISNISFDDFENILSTIDSDYWKGEELEGRFHPLFGKPNRNKIVKNSLDKIRHFLKVTYNDEDVDNVDELMSEIKGMWYGSASLFFYVKDPDHYNVFLQVTVDGIKRIYTAESKNLHYRRPFHKNYSLFNKLCEKLKTEYSLKPQELDIVLTVFGKREERS